jgi:protein TonB
MQSTPHHAPFSLSTAIAFSVALHAFFLLPVLLWKFKPAEVVSNDKLVVELYGMISDRQEQARSPGAKMESPVKPPPKVETTKTKVEQTEKKKSVTQNVESSVLIADQSEQKTKQTAEAAPSPSNDSEQQKQQTLNQDKRLDELKKYLAKLKKKVQGNLVYPEEAKQSGFEGTPIVKFTLTESGGIRPGSLVIARSSGYAVLDLNAMKAAQESAPFDRPDREMEVAIGVGFGLNK